METQQQKNLARLEAFIADLKADRDEQKARERGASWTTYTSMSIVIVAVLAAMASLWSTRYSNAMLARLNGATFHQAKASDQWSFYQAKSIKQNLYEVSRDQMGVGAVNASVEVAKALESFNARVARYEKEKKEIQAEAERFERLRDESQAGATLATRKLNGMNFAVALLQISIALASICLMTKRKGLWYLSMVVAAVAAADMIWSWLI